ncbi:MAG: substrate-binding domain-containing protein, partial [Rhizobiaceae bacterium]|nr:substrate-binding domain-containing protein [Rhizobiaceae bacterium]
EPLTHFILTRTDIQLVVRIGTQEDVLEEVREGISDIGCFLSNEDMRRLNNQIIGAQRLRLVCAPDHPLAGLKNVSPAEVAKHGFVGPPPGSMFGKSVTRLLSDIGIQDMRVVAQATEYQFLRELVAGGVGISCSPEKSVEADIRSGRLNFIDVKAPDLLFDIRLISLKNRAMSGPMQELSEYLRHNMPTL